MTRPLHVSQLVALVACSYQVDLFRSLFGESVEVSVDLAVEHASKFDFGFAARLLSPASRAEYARQHAPLLAEYAPQCAPLLAEYERQRAQLWASLYIADKVTP